MKDWKGCPIEIHNSCNILILVKFMFLYFNGKVKDKFIIKICTYPYVAVKLVSSIGAIFFTIANKGEIAGTSDIAFVMLVIFSWTTEGRIWTFRRIVKSERFHCKNRNRIKLVTFYYKKSPKGPFTQR